jgi:hypothetical protein
LLSKIDVKRRRSNGGEEAAALGVSLDEETKMRPVGNRRKSKGKIHETEEHPKTVTENACVTNIPGETSSSGGSQSSVKPDQLRLLFDNSVTTNLSQPAISPPTSRSTRYPRCCWCSCISGFPWDWISRSREARSHLPSK